MITNLKIQNFTLIDSLDIDFQRGFSVITGETGAGKSIILGALSMLLGNRADSKSVKLGAQRCVVEAHFNIEGYNLDHFFEENELDNDPADCILRRELSAAGKSRAFINDTPVSLTVMRELGEQLVDIHSQHQNLLLRNADFQLSVVDIIARNQKQRDLYSAAFRKYQQEQRKLKEMQAQMSSNREQEDYMRFQLEELQAADLSDADEQQELEQQAEAMNHSEDIKAALFNTDNALGNEEIGILRQLHQASNEMASIASLLTDASEVSERMESAYIELKDISAEIASLLDKAEFDPQEKERIEERLDTFYTLEKKYHCESLAELIALRDDIAGKLALIDNSDEALSEQQKLVDDTRKEAEKQAQTLSETRTKAARTVEKEMKQRLVPLGIPKVQFVVQQQDTDLSISGKDSITFLFSANTSTAAQPVAQVASGGEIARVMLSLKAMISNAVSLPTIIFDEIDTGVSGKIAEAMAVIMKDMGDHGRQVISITHLPQIAALGSEHYRVQKSEKADGTHTNMKHLSAEERIDEIAQMLSGSSISDAARQQAKELLAVNG